MRDTLSKRTKSPSASPSATPNRSRKTSGSKSASISLRQKSTVKVAPSKTLVGRKSVPVTKTQKKAVALKKKNSTDKKQKAGSPVAQVMTAKKSSSKTPNKSINIERPKVKVQANISKNSRSTPKSVISSPRVPRQQVTTQALRAFERAVKTFNLRQFSEAKTLFEELQKRYHQEVEIISRSQTYIQVCNVRLAGNRILPRNADEFYDRGVVALNVGNFAQARSFFEKALKLRPDDSHTLYSLAATHAQTGSTDQALTYLQQAVQRQPRLRQRALQDTDFSPLKDDRRFLELLGATSPFDLLGTRREMS